jgi:RecA-family ATPase
LVWNGHRTKQGDVVLVAGEGFAGYPRRLKALESKYGIEAPSNFFISERAANFSDSVNTKFVADSIRAVCAKPGLIVIDTMHRNTEADENSAQDIGVFINNIDTHFKPLGAAVLIVHHSGHNDKGRSRGSSAIRGGGRW